MNTYDVTYGYITPDCCVDSVLIQIHLLAKRSDCVERVKAENKEEAEKIMEQFFVKEGIRGQIRHVEQVR